MNLRSYSFEKYWKSFPLTFLKKGINYMNRSFRVTFLNNTGINGDQYSGDFRIPSKDSAWNFFFLFDLAVLYTFFFFFKTVLIYLITCTQTKITAYVCVDVTRTNKYPKHFVYIFSYF